MELLSILSAFGLSASAGLNAYIPLLVVALLAKFSPFIQLNSPWDTLTSWWVIGILIVLSTIEFFADKIPAVNHVNDILQTFVRPTAGAILFAADAHAITQIHPVLALAIGLLVAGGVHSIKSLAIRPAVTATTGGAGNVPVSIAEDLISTLVSLVSVVVPIVIACILVCLTAWFVYILWERSRRVQQV
jgi:hypothetical protein